MFKKSVISIMVTILLVLFGCGILSNYNMNNWGSKTIDKIEGSMMFLHTIGEVKYKDTSPQKAETGGVCWPIGDGYLIALTHATKLEPVIRYGYYLIKREILKEKFYVKRDAKVTTTKGTKEVKLIGRIDDISVFYHKDFKNSKVLKWADSDKVRLGDKVLIIGSSFHISYNIKEGVISVIKEKEDHRLPNITKNTFTIAAPVNSGDSGSPMLIKNSEGLQVVGIVNAGIAQVQGINFALKGNYIKDCVKKIIGKDILTQKEDLDLDKR